MNTETTIIKSIEENLKLQEKASRLRINNLGSEWQGKMAIGPQRFIEKNTNIKLKALQNFRRDRIFFGDIPLGMQNIFNIRNFIDGARRGHARMLKGLLKIIEDNGYAGLLRKYPCSKVGNPHIFNYRGYQFTYEWLRHVYFLGLFKKYLEPEVKENFVALDLGCFYGLFSGLLMKEFAKSHHILVDLPQQLSLAHYYLGRYLPDASIASYKEIAELNTIDRSVIEKYNFILLPCYFYNKIERGSVDIFTNFMSLQEMSKDYFDNYIKHEPFLSSRFFLTVNRYQSAPTYDNGLTILDYPLSDFIKLHFATTPIAGERYKRFMLFFYTYFPYPSQHFEFIGKR